MIRRRPQPRLHGGGRSTQRGDGVLTMAAGDVPPGVLAHAARHDPARVLHDVAAERRVHGAYRRAKPGSMNRSGLTIALQGLACAWSDHPDFDTTWRT